MANVQLDYSDIEEIFKEKLKIDNIVKKVKTIFLNQRYYSKIDYKPYFQRNYVWDDEKASYFIESIILGTEIPPIVLFEAKTETEVIDGRQRFETISKFLNDKLTLKESGLHSLKKLSGKKYSQLNVATKEIFEETRIRIIQFSVVDEPKLDDEKEDKIKKEIFRRYNSGITPLQKYEIERAAFIYDDLSNLLLKKISENSDLFDFLSQTILPRSKRKNQKRDKANILVSLVRTLITLPYIPIVGYARATSKSEIIGKVYEIKFEECTQEDLYEIIESFTRKVLLIKILYKNNKNEYLIKNNLFFETLYWALSVSEMDSYFFDNQDLDEINECLQKADSLDEIWNGIIVDEKSINAIYENTGSHYYSSINSRYRFIANVFNMVTCIDYSQYLRGSVQIEEKSEVEEVDQYKLNKPLPETLTIEDVLSEMQNDRFLIRPEYQRSEVKDVTKAAYLMESILLGISIPPIFIYKRNDKIKEVVDGQQRLLTIIGFLGKTYLNESGEFTSSTKDKFKLTKLRILKDLNGKSIDSIGEEFENKILDYPIDVIEIDQLLNPEFSQIDLFLRLNTKPYPIKENTFEMWNAYVAKEVTAEVKNISQKYQQIVFRKKDNRMKLEELIVSLAYLEYKVFHQKTRMTSILNVYIRNERLCARIKNKDNVTKLLSDVSNEGVDSFIRCLQTIEVFAIKIVILLKDNGSFKDLVKHFDKSSSYKTDQNFYFLWIMLHGVPIESIQKDSKKWFDYIVKNFENLHNISSETEIDTFINSLLDSDPIPNITESVDMAYLI